MLRPNVVLFGEDLDEEVMDAAHEELENCDLCLVVGTSSVVYPAAMFAPQVNYNVSGILKLLSASGGFFFFISLFIVIQLAF